MRAIKHQVIEAGFAFFRATRLHKGLSPWTRGRGAILMLHHVRPFSGAGFAPNRLLEITPDFLDAALVRLDRLGFDLVSMDEAVRRMSTTQGRPFVALTFDDGYADMLTHALPILERHEAPFTLYITTGFADRTARMWWSELEEAIRRLDRIETEIDGARFVQICADDAGKATAFHRLYWLLREGPEERLRAAIGRLTDQVGIDPAALVADLCLDWDGIRSLARNPLCAIGAHTLTHPMLAKHDVGFVRRELTESRRRIESEIGLPVRHLAYPVGDLGSAGPRDYAIAADLGFSSAVTTRPGMIFPEHRGHRTALPRLSVNGNWQSLDSLEVLLSGVPFALWNRGRRVVV